MAIDDSFKKPGAIPFKWEIRPGVPKVQQHQPSASESDEHHSLLQQSMQQLHQKLPSSNLNHSFPRTQQKLKPPPGGFHFLHPMELQIPSFHSAQQTLSERYHFDGSKTFSGGCFPSPLHNIGKSDKKKNHMLKSGFESESEYISDLESFSRRSVSTQKSFSPSSSSFSSYQSSPRPLGDAEWAGFGLF